MQTNRYTQVAISTLTAFILGFLPPLASGDVTVRRSLKLKSLTGEGSIQAQHIMQVRGRAARRETEVLVNGALANEFHYPIRTITWTSLDQGVIQIWDYTRGAFEKIPISRWTSYLTKRNSSTDPSGFRISQTWSRVIPEDEIKIVRGQRCSKFTYEWRFEIENPETYAKKQYAVQTTLWLTELSPVLIRTLNEEKSFQADYHKRLGGRALEDLNAVTMQYASNLIGLNKETLFEAISQGTSRLQRIGGYPIASKTEWFLVGYKTNKPLFTVTSELEALSLKPLAETVLVPSKKFISAYDEAETNAQLIARGE